MSDRVEIRQVASDLWDIYVDGEFETAAETLEKAQTVADRLEVELQ